MANEPDAADPAARLEAALERIARVAPAAAPGAPSVPPDPAAVPEGMSRAALISRLDRVIGRLRAALDEAS